MFVGKDLTPTHNIIFFAIFLIQLVDESKNNNIMLISQNSDNKRLIFIVFE